MDNSSLFQMSDFSRTIMEHKYSHALVDGSKESWRDIAKRQRLVLKTVNAPKSLIDQAEQFIAERKFIPGGRYLYAVGRPFHQVQNCLLLRAEDSREGWADLMQKITMALMTGAGIGVDYSEIRPEGKIIRKTGGFATGPLALMQMVNEAGRGIMQGGSRRSAIWAGLKWSHPDVHKFITMKNWSPEVREMKAKDFNFPAMMDGTNISVLLDDEFFAAYDNDNHAKHSLASSVYWAVVEQMLKTAEPGFSIDTGKNSRETLRNAPVIGSTSVTTRKGIKRVSEIVGVPTAVWTGKQWAYDVVFSKTGTNVPTVTVQMTGGRSLTSDPSHPFIVERYVGKGAKRRLVALDRVPAAQLQRGDILHVSLPVEDEGGVFDIDAYADAYTMGFLYGDGSFRDGHAELSICDDSKVVCGNFIKRRTSLSYTIVDDARPYERLYFNTNHEAFDGRDKAVFPPDFRSDYEYAARSFLAGLFDADGSYNPIQNRVRLGSVNYEFLRDCQRVLEWLGIQANISKGSNSGYTDAPSWQLVVAADSVSEFARLIPTLRLQPDGYDAYRPMRIKVLSVVSGPNADVFCADVKVPEHTFMAEGVIISNCTEVTSADDSDICNLGSINMARVESLSEMAALVEVGSAFLLAGTVYSDVPYAKVDMIRTKNRRLGLGLMGIHEWLLRRGKRYGVDAELDKYLTLYATSTGFAHSYADKWDLSHPVKTRAIAPTGTIGIIAETTTGVEPMLAAAYKRRYLKGNSWNYQYVIESLAHRAVEQLGVKPEDLEDAYTLAAEPERRLRFQAHVQGFVDHAISSTINLQPWGSEQNNRDTVQAFGKKLLKELPNLRGVTCYPDGARGGQPLTAVRYATAVRHIGKEFSENGAMPVAFETGDVCDLTKGGSCGS